MRVGLTTGCARLVGLDPQRTIELLERAGVDGVELDGELPHGLLVELERRLAAARDALPVWAVAAPYPGGAVATARLASLDRDEARAATDAALASVRRAAEVGAALVTVRLGDVEALAARWASLRRAFLRGELDGATRETAARERAARGAAHLDPARRALDRLARAADTAGVRIGVRTPSRLVGLPSAPELRALLDDLAGAPVVPVWDLAASHLLACFGVGAEETAAAWSSAPLVQIADACGPLAGLAPGTGEVDFAAIGSALRAERATFAPWEGLTADEVVDGIAAARRLLSAPRA